MASNIPIFSAIFQIMKINAKSMHFRGGATIEISSLGKESSEIQCINAHPPQFFFLSFLDMNITLGIVSNSFQNGVMA